MSRVMVIGLDGANWKVLSPLIQRGKLPNLQRLTERGVSGTLESTFPPVTAPAWLSMATGKNPGKTGIYDFLSRKGRDSYSNEILNSYHFRRNRTYWDLLGEEASICILNYPRLCPPYKISGVMISGTGCLTTEEICYPPNLKRKLDELTDGYKISLFWNDPKYYNNQNLFINDLKDLIKKRIKVNQYLLKKRKWDLFITIFSACDYLQHVMWKIWEASSPFLEYERFIDVWQKIDEGVGKIFSFTDEKTFLFIVSDHGFGPLNENFLVNRWLEKEGFLIRNRGFQLPMRRIIKKLFELVPKRLSKNILKISFPTAIADLQSNFNPTLNKINISKSLAFGAGHTSSAHGAIYVDQKQSNYEEIRNRIIKKLKLLEKHYGKDFKVKCYKPEEIYSGDKVNLAPDILFKINDHRCNIQENRFNGKIFQRKVPFKNKTGSHRKYGVFIVKGPYIKESGTKINKIRIYDIAPTILHIFGLPIPNDMDGRVLKEIFKKSSSIGQKKVQYYKVDEEKKRIKQIIRHLKLKQKI